jgi:protein SEY1
LLIPLLSKMELSATSKPPPVAEFIGKKPHSFIATSDDEDDDVEIDEDVMVILTDAKQVGLQDRFRKMADGIYVEAKRSTISSVSQIPIWFYGLLVILGWNEFWAVLRSPLYFMFLLLIGAGAYVAHTLNLWGPMVRIGNAMLNQTVEIGREQLRSFIESSKAPSLREEVPLQNLTKSGTTETRKSEAEDEEW